MLMTAQQVRCITISKNILLPYRLLTKPGLYLFMKVKLLMLVSFLLLVAILLIFMKHEHRGCFPSTEALTYLHSPNLKETQPAFIMRKILFINQKIWKAMTSSPHFPLVFTMTRANRSCAKSKYSCLTAKSTCFRPDTG